eukprot:TRINITY_DN4868_c0_g1_i2.p1 TRINITY_DN4868_c0_g1~~TRINITY_DN4868_c0_g1_i2.p1  ORF type:complete len:312 (+),score=80.08 TRINITY_DN4868_c0_g1_i2:37-972(+)
MDKEEGLRRESDALRKFAKRLHEIHHLLESTLEEYDNYRIPGTGEGGGGGVRSEDKRATWHAIPIADVIAYSHRISCSTFAPPDFPHSKLLHGALPPAPQEEQMRTCYIYKLTEKDLGLVVKPPPVDEKTANGEAPLSSQQNEAGAQTSKDLPPGGGAAAVAAAGGPAASASAIDGFLFPPHLPPPPPGWKPGDPLPQLPLLPPGWKPGDPIPLSNLSLPPGWNPGDAIPLPLQGQSGGAAASQQPPAPSSQSQLPPATAIPPHAGVSMYMPRPPAAQRVNFVVPLVELDLNPELEDDSSDDESDEDEEEE